MISRLRMWDRRSVADRAEPVLDVRAGVRAGTVRLGSMGFTFLATVLLARRFSTAEFGVYALAMVALFIGGLVGSAGIGRVGLRTVTPLLLANELDTARSVTRSAVPVFAVSAPIGGLVAFVLCMLSTPRAFLPLGSCAVVGIASCGAAVMFATSDLLRVWERSFLADVTDGLNGLVTSLLFAVFLIAFQSDELTTVLAQQMVAMVLPALPAVWWLASRRGALPGMSVRVWVRGGMVYVWTSLASIVNAMADVWVASWALGVADVGRYAGAARLAVLTTLPQAAAQMAFVRDIIRLIHENRLADLQSRLRRASTLVVFVASPTIVAVVAPHFVLSTVLGADYGPGAPVLALLAGAYLGTVALGLSGLVISMSGNEPVNLLASGVASLVTLGGGYIGARLFGLAGLAVVSASASLTSAAVRWYIVRKRVGVWTHPHLLPPY